MPGATEGLRRNGVSPPPQCFAGGPYLVSGGPPYFRYTTLEGCVSSTTPLLVISFVFWKCSPPCMGRNEVTSSDACRAAVLLSETLSFGMRLVVVSWDLGGGAHFLMSRQLVSVSTGAECLVVPFRSFGLIP